MTIDGKQTLGRFAAACKKALETLAAKNGSMFEGFPKGVFRAIRMGPIAKPASAKLGGSPPVEAARSAAPDELLTTDEKAARRSPDGESTQAPHGGVQ
jgi:hypothetical protein